MALIGTPYYCVQQSFLGTLLRETTRRKMDGGEANDFFAFRAVVQFLVLRGKSNAEIHHEMVEAYGDKAPSSQFVSKWALRFRRGRTSLEDDPRSGRPPTTSGLAEQVQKLLLERPFESVRSMADEFGVSRETIRLTLTRRLHMSKFMIRWVPHTLSAAQKQMRVERAGKILEHLQSPGGREKVITGDETWVYHEYARQQVGGICG